MPCQALVRMLAKKPGWKETNFQVTHYPAVTTSPFLLLNVSCFQLQDYSTVTADLSVVSENMNSEI